MRAPRDIPGIEPELLEHYPADSLRALGQRLGLEDARAGSSANTSYITFALERLAAYKLGFGAAAMNLTKEEMHEFVVGLVTGLDECKRALRSGS